jgi:hypothetical protein
MAAKCFCSTKAEQAAMAASRMAVSGLVRCWKELMEILILLK